MSLASKDRRIPILKDRAAMLAKARAFFAERGIMEVDCPILSRGAAIDAHIDLISANLWNNSRGYLHSSPEYPMKRLLSEGIGDIYQLSHVFRDGEHSQKHNPEFTMAEWYRVDGSFEDLIEETLAFIRLFLGSLPKETLTYRQALLQCTGLDYTVVTPQDLTSWLAKEGIATQETDKDNLLNIILGLFVEPHLGHGSLCVITHYPSSQAALAQTFELPDETVALRFEIYYSAIELANGYLELTNPKEQRQRLIEANATRAQLGKETLPIDEYFLDALQKGLPSCSGVAVGFDRLMMLRHSCQHIHEILPFSWDVI